MTMDPGEGHERVTLEGNPTTIRKYRHLNGVRFAFSLLSFLSVEAKTIGSPELKAICSLNVKEASSRFLFSFIHEHSTNIPRSKVEFNG